MSVAIIDYGSGNLHSAAKAFERAARSMEQPEEIVVTRDPEAVFRADLEQNLRNPRSLYGLLKSLEAQKKAAGA